MSTTKAERDDVKSLIKWYEQRGRDWSEAAEFLLCKYNGGLRRKTKCLICEKPIGRARYVLDAGTARFGTLLVLHWKCDEDPEATEAKALKIAKRQGRLKKLAA